MCEHVSIGRAPFCMPVKSSLAFFFHAQAAESLQDRVQSVIEEHEGCPPKSAIHLAAAPELHSSAARMGTKQPLDHLATAVCCAVQELTISAAALPASLWRRSCTCQWMWVLLHFRCVPCSYSSSWAPFAALPLSSTSRPSRCNSSLISIASPSSPSSSFPWISISQIVQWAL